MEHLSAIVESKYGIHIDPEDFREGKNGCYFAKHHRGYIIARQMNKLGAWKVLMAHR